MTDHTDRPGPPRRRTGLAVAAAVVALGLGALGAAAAGAFADAGGSTGSAGDGAPTTLVQDGTTTPGQQAPDRGDCPGEGGGSQGGGSQDGGGQGSSTTPS